MAINAVMDGTTHSNVSSISVEGRSSTKTIQLTETGVIPTPSGTKSITQNGTHDVTNYANAQVNVPQGITPSGTKSISANGTYDVTNYASAEVNVPSSGITPSGSTEITSNGTYDVTALASVVVNVPTSSGSSIASGTYTPESNSKNASFTVPAGITNFVFYATDFNAGLENAGWHTVGGIWFNGVGQGFIRYNNANASAGSLTASLSGTTLSITAPYNLRTEKTYKWFAW